MTEFVLDASAVLALLQKETGHEKVAAALAGARISTVNLAEVGSRLANLGRSVVQVRTMLLALGLRIVPFDQDQAFETARLRPLTRSLALSLSDRSCLALARLQKLPAMTTDRAWRNLSLGIQIAVIR